MTDMYMYPKHVRKALSKLISKNLSIEKLSRKYVNCLLDYGLHGLLPPSLYKYVIINYGVEQIKYFSPAIVSVTDLITTITKCNSIDEHLKKVIFYHRRYLLCSGLQIVKKLIEHELLTKDDINWIINEDIMNAVNILKINPLLANSNMILNRKELLTLFSTVSTNCYKFLYDTLYIKYDDILYLSFVLDIPPLHSSLTNLRSFTIFKELVLKYPYENIITYLSPIMIYKKEFINDLLILVDETVDDLFIPSIYDLLYITTPHCNLIQRYGIVKCVAMFAFSINNIECNSLTQDEKLYIEKHINIFDIRCRNFSIKFRNYIIKTEGRVITMNVNNIIEKWTTVRKKSINEDELSYILTYLCNYDKEPSLEVIKEILQSVRLNPCVCRQTLLSQSLDKKTKILILRVIKKWCIKPITIRDNYKRIHGQLLLNLMETLSVNILSTNKMVLKIIRHNQCELFQRCLHTKRTSIDLNNDTMLLKCLNKMVISLMQGYIIPNLIETVGWGPLKCLAFGSVYINMNDLHNVLTINSLKQSALKFVSINIANIATNIDCISIYDIIPSATPINDSHAKTIILLNTLIEYMIIIISYRVAVLQKFTNIREFISKMITIVLESFYIRFCFSSIRVNECIELEIEQMLEKGHMPIHFIHLCIRVALLILNDINGTY
ncbi:hypothetical protein [Cetacean poxvirus 1]|nr:hypothetical protein [Cetacean poxvirus 1]